VDELRAALAKEGIPVEQALELLGFLRDGGMEDEPEPQDEEQRRIRQRVQQLRIDQQAKRQLAAEGWQKPPGHLWGSLTDFLAMPAPDIQHRIGHLLGLHHNATLVAQYKTGKTQLLGNVARSLADGSPFLGQFDTEQVNGNVAVWNGEMDQGDFIDKYLRPLSIRKTDKLQLLHLRGMRVPLLSDEGLAWAIEWMEQHQVDVWLNDSWGRLCAWSGVNENDNGEVYALCQAIDHIKSEAGVATFLTTVHTGRAEQEVGKERARGATALDDWVDSRWVYTKDNSGARFLMVEGRNVGMDETQLNFSTETGELWLGQGNRQQAKNLGNATIVATFVADHPEGVTKTAVKAYLKEQGVASAPTQVAAIKSAVEHSLIVVTKQGTSDVCRPTVLMEQS
jgi:hypothetical protein